MSFGRAGNLTLEAGLRGARKGAAKTAERARFYAAELGPKAAAARAADNCLQAIAVGMSADEYRTPTGRPRDPVQVSRVLARYRFLAA